MTASVQLPLLQRHPLEPPPELCALQSAGAIHRVRTQVGDEAWLVTGYPEVRRLMDAEALGRSLELPDRNPARSVGASG